MRWRWIWRDGPVKVDDDCCKISGDDACQRRDGNIRELGRGMWGPADGTYHARVQDPPLKSSGAFPRFPDQCLPLTCSEGAVEGIILGVCWADLHLPCWIISGTSFRSLPPSPSLIDPGRSSCRRTYRHHASDCHMGSDRCFSVLNDVPIQGTPRCTPSTECNPETSTASPAMNSGFN